jgi:hypothetical protein
MSGGHRHPPRPPHRPPPPDDDEDDDHPRPRCYFCGRRIRRERDVEKVEYHMGHGYTKRVFICPPCYDDRPRGSCLVIALTVLLPSAVALALGAAAALAR